MSAINNEVKFVKNATTKVVGSSNAVALDDAIFASLSKSNQFIAVLAETYTTVPVMCIKYTQGFGITGDTIDALSKAMQL